MFKSIRNLFGGDTESDTPDFKKLKDDVHATLVFVEELISLAQGITSEKLTLRCRNCAKKEHIKYSKEAIFIVSEVQSQQNASRTTSHRSHDNRTSKRDTSVDGHTKYNPVSENREPNRYARVTEETERNHEHASDYVQDTLIKEGTGDERITEITTTGRKATNQLREKLEKAELEKSKIEEMFEAKKKELIELQDESSKKLAEEIDENEKLKLSLEDLQRDLKNERSKYTHLKSNLGEKEEDNKNIRKQLDKSLEDLRKSNAKIENLSRRIDSIEKSRTEDRRDYGRQKDGLKRQYDIVMKQSQTEQRNLESELSDLKKAKEKISDDLRKSNAGNDNLNRRIENMEKIWAQERKDYERQTESMNSKMDDLTKEISSKQTDIDSLDKQIEVLQRTCAAKDAEIKSMKSKMADIEREIVSKQKEIGKLDDEKKRQQTSFDKEYRRFKSNIASLEEEILGLKKDLADWEERSKKKLDMENIWAQEREDYERQTGALKKQVTESEISSISQASEIATLKDKIQELNAELSALAERARKTLVINFHTTLKESLALPAKQHIVRGLKEKCKSDDIPLEVKQYKSPQETPGPILVLCMNVSTLRTDVKDALKGTPENFEVIVLVLHHREVHALPVQASDRLLTGEGYKQLGAIVDAAFWTGKGMYDCELNKLAMEKIYNFFSGFVPK